MNIVFLALICVPVVEIAVLISVGGILGLPLTIALILGTAFLGTYLLRQQGLSVLMSAQSQISQGQLPATAMAEGIVLAVGGALLLTPGFVTDAVGFACLVPFSRRLLINYMSRRLQSSTASYSSTFSYSNGDKPRSEADDGVTLEGEFKKEP